MKYEVDSLMRYGGDATLVSGENVIADIDDEGCLDIQQLHVVPGQVKPFPKTEMIIVDRVNLGASIDTGEVGKEINIAPGITVSYQVGDIQVKVRGNRKPGFTFNNVPAMPKNI